MNTITRRQFLYGTSVLSATTLAACSTQNTASQETSSNSPTRETSSTAAITLDATKWQYNAADDVYYQLGIPYCAQPADQNYEQLALFVPGAYFEAQDNGNGTFTCRPNDSKSVAAYTATTAPIVMPVNTPGYSAQKPLSEYTSPSTYTSKGFVYVHAGCRGRDAGAPSGVVDLKAAIRFLRASSANMAGNTDRIFTFGMSGGGAQSAILGATGDSDLYTPYLKAIGAADASDATFGSMDWCPITGLDVGDAAYEWMMGSTRTGLTTEDQAISNDLAKAFAAYVNESGLVDEGNTALRLEESDEGICQAGSYYQRVLRAIETSINDFLSDTTFPYEVSAGQAAGPGDGMPSGRPDSSSDGTPPDDTFTMDNGENDDTDGNSDASTDMGPGPDGKWGGARRGSGGPTPATGGTESAPDNNLTEAPADNISRTQNDGGIDMAGTYQTAADYVAALNVDETWVMYDEGTNTATVVSVAAFCTALKRATKGLGAFDQLDRGQGENTLFGVDGKAAHFDATLARILEEQQSTYASDYTSDLTLMDAFGTDMQTRINMYTPLYYLLPTSAGHGTSNPAKHWRIRSGINQGDTALTCELNLALALEADTRVQSVDFATIWGQGHTMAERSGSAEENFITWVNACLTQQK